MLMSSWQIGDVRITKIVERESTGSIHRFLLLDATPEACKEIAWLHPHFMTEQGELHISVHALVVETPRCRIIVDTCFGNDKKRTRPGFHMLSGPFLHDLDAAGFPVDGFDYVMCTHLHVDHVGWNTVLVDGTWEPTFKKARYLMATTEYAYWCQNRDEQQFGDYFGDSVKPVFDAGLVELVAANHRVCDEVWLEPTPGHSPGHVSVRIASRGEQALITGDFMHHPCQMARPHWCSTADYDQRAAEATRRRMLAQLADEPTLVIGTHFAGVTAGRVVRDGAVWCLNTDA
jgi:glyoxylase-like metal-dependent hydrolase (beta-lactamase superfamily II)